MAAREFLSARLDRGAVPLAVGDVLVIVALLAYGVAHHNGTDFVLGNPGYVTAIVVPFLIGWLLAALPLGAYSPGAAESAKAAVPLGVRSWIAAALIGVGLRATPAFPGDFAAIFFGVTLVLGAILLGLWRSVWFRLR